MPTVHTVTTQDEIYKAFPEIDETLIVHGELGAFEIFLIMRHLWECAQSHEYPASETMNMLYLMMDETFYANFTDEAFPHRYYPWPDSPPPFACYANCADQNARNSLDDQRAYAMKLSQEAKSMHKALKKRLVAYLPETVKAEWKKKNMELPNATIAQMMTWLVDEYAHTTEEERIALRQSMCDDWNPADGIMALVSRLTAIQQFFLMINQPITVNDILDAGNQVIKATGLFTHESKEWLKVTPKTVATWKEYWKEAFKIARMANPTLAKNVGHGMNAAQEEAETRFEDTVKAYGKASMMREESMANITAENKRLQEENMQKDQMIFMMQQQNQQQSNMNGQQQFNSQFNANQYGKFNHGNNNFGRNKQFNGNQFGGNQFGGNQFGGNQFNDNIFGGNQYGGINQFGAHQNGNNQFGGNQYGRHNSRNNKNNFGAGMNRNTKAGATGPPQGVMIDNVIGRGSDGRNYVKFHNNFGYCPNCGFDIPGDHFANGCCPATGRPYNPMFTRQNPAPGGVRKSSHKFILPSTVGKMDGSVRLQMNKMRREQRKNQRQNRQQRMPMQQTSMMNMMAGNPQMAMGQQGMYGGINPMGMNGMNMNGGMYGNGNPMGMNNMGYGGGFN